jgi:hypothetical protein
MRKALFLFALISLACLANAQRNSLVIARDGSVPLSEMERHALFEPTEQNIAKLIDAGYQRLSIDNWGILLIDPVAPPLAELRIEKLLLTELPLDGSPIKFGSLGNDAKLAVKNSGASVNNQFTDDTLVAFHAFANFKFARDGKSHTMTSTLAGPSHEQIQLMSKSPAPGQDLEVGKKLADRRVSVRSELAFDMWQRPEAKAELHKRCNEEIAKLVEKELKARDEARLAALRYLAQKHQIPDESWTRPSIPDNVLRSLGANFTGSWRALGFNDDNSATEWFAGASLANANVSFNIAFGDGGAPSNTAVLGLVQFGRTGR